MENNTNYINIKNNDTIAIQEEKRNGILYYSISQVAALLGETDSQIRYYTNIFDNLLKIQVSNKELIYTDKDIDKLEFLIRLKNKGLTIKEIQSYCEELPLDESDVVTEGNALSIPDFIELISELQTNQIAKLKSELFNHLDSMKEELSNSMKDYINSELSNNMKDYINAELSNNLKDYMNTELSNNMKDYINSELSNQNENSQLIADELFLKVENSLKEELSNSMKDYINTELSNSMKDYINTELSNTMKDYINSELSNQNENSQLIADELFLKVENSLTNKFETENLKMQKNLSSLSNEIEIKSIELHDQLLSRIKKFENVIEKAYTIELEIASQKSPNFMTKLFGLR